MKNSESKNNKKDKQNESKNITNKYLGGDRLKNNYPWAISFGFGLIHGLGFAGVLREVGLPDDAAFWALLLFNVGLEIGQLIVVAVCLFLGFLIRNWQRKITAVQDLSLGNLLPAYFIGPISVWWLLQRLPVLG